MTTVTGKLNDLTINGIIRATPDHPFVDTTVTPNVLVVSPITAAIASGVFSITVPQSQVLAGTLVTTEGITYYWEMFQTVNVTTFYFLSGAIYSGPTHLHTDGIYYTGSVHTSDSVRLDRVISTINQPIGIPIHAIAPNLSTVAFTDLINIPSQQPYLDISVYRLAELMTTIPTYSNRISAKFAIKGTYNPATSYVLNDLVSYNGNSYVWKNASSLSGQTPPLTGDNANWFMIAQKGDAGGTGATIVGYNPTLWAGSAQAAAREDVRAAIASVSSIDLTNYYTKAEAAPKANAVFTGSTKRATLTYPVATGDLTTEIPTADYVEQAILAKGYGGFAAPLVHARRINEFSLTRDTTSVIIWDNRVINTGTLVDTNGRIAIAATGNYLFFFTGLFEYSGSASASTNRSQTSLIVSQDTGGGAFSDLGNIIFENDTSQAAVFRDRKLGFGFYALTAGLSYCVRALLAGTGLNSSGHSLSPGGSGQNNYFLMWKVG